MRECFYLPLCVLVHTGSTAQNIRNPYADHSGQEFLLDNQFQGTGVDSYIGEYQIFLDDLFWKQLADGGATVTYKIEAVGFPFVPPAQAPGGGSDRRFIMPELESYGFNAGTGDCAGWAWLSNDHDPLASPLRNLMRVHTGGFTGNESGSAYYMSDEAALISNLFHGVAGQIDCATEHRVFYPHTTLKHTLYLRQDGFLLDSLSWIYDHTRGRMRYYPFAAYGEGDLNDWDLSFRPFLVYDHASGHAYNSTSNDWLQDPWYNLSEGTANYFPPPPNTNDWLDILFPSDPSVLFDPDALSEQIVHPPPYALLEAPLLNARGDAYAGFALDLNEWQQTFFDGELSWETPHDYTIDKPLDLRLINPSERIIYNPSEADIDLPGQTLVFPSGYTFKTVHGAHPSRTAVEAIDPGELYPHPLLAPVPSTLGTSASTYRVKDGSTLVIEPCVTIMDAEIVVETGATLIYDPALTSGNYTVTDGGGTIDTTPGTAPAKPCPADCFTIEFNDVKDLDVTATQTWSPGSIPADGNSDDILRVAGTVRVKAGAVLTINTGVTLEFGPYAKFIVERGARVLAYNSTFTSACENMWHGVEAWGTRNEAQVPYTGNTAQGIFSAYGCTFENAREALRAYRSDDPTGAAAEFNGGVVIAQYCTFRNNHRSAHVKPTRNMYYGVEASNACQFLNNEFVCDRYLVDPAYGDGYGNHSAPDAHILLKGVKRVWIHQNSFTNDLPGTDEWLPHLRGTGVHAYDSDFTLSYNNFSGMSEAVWHDLGGTKNPSATARIRWNTINDCLHGIVTVGTAYDEIIGNTINLPLSPQYGYSDDDPNQGYDYPVGIYTQESHDFHIEGNTITGVQTEAAAQYKSYAMVINQSNAEDAFSAALIHMNEASGVSIGLQCEGDNRGDDGAGLMIECNEFLPSPDVLDHDIAVVGNWIEGTEVIGGKLRDQGACDFPELQAGNHFSSHNTLTSTLEHLYFDDNTLPDNAGFWYRDRPVDLPTAAESNTPNVEGCLLGVSRECLPLLNCGKPCIVGRGEAEKSLIGQLEVALSATADAEEIAALERQLDLARVRMRTIRNSMVRYVLEYEEVDSLLNVLGDEEGESKLRRLVPAYIEKGWLAGADSLIALLIAEEGDPSVATLLLQLRASLQGGLLALTDAQLEDVQAMVQAAPLGAMVARAILHHELGLPYSRVPWMINDTLPGLRSTEQEQELTTLWVRLYPNPSSGQAWLEATNMIVLAEVMGVDGRLIPMAPFVPSDRIAIDLLGPLAPGCYWVRIGSIDGRMTSLPLMITSKP